MRKLNIPISDNDIRSLEVGEPVVLSGVMLTGRDAVHKWMIDTFIRKTQMPEGDDEEVYKTIKPILDGGVIYHCGPVVAGMESRDVVIADGHHRYETALAYRAEQRAAEGDPSETRPYDFVLTYLTNAEADGLCTLGTHRIISGKPSVDLTQLLGSLEQDFELLPFEQSGSLAQAIGDASSGSIAIGAYLGHAEKWILRLKNAQRSRPAADPGWPDDPQELDVTVLQKLILAPHFGILPETLATTERVSYTIDEREACEQVRTGRAQSAFILRPTSVDQIWRAALQGVTMPQKSTYFYPKLLTGLVFNPLYDDPRTNPRSRH